MGDVWVRSVDGHLIRESSIFRISANGLEARVWPLDNPEASLQVALDPGGAPLPEGFDVQLAGEFARWRADHGAPLVVLEATRDGDSWHWQAVQPSG
ncbi:hypothetical protein ACSNOI_31345 [Actinomadura kijaniata]|uniref:hypothetical protein n=1 Tax=Actinomadura kijaniata TaxID=46161 RepID=UPI003F1994A7